MTPPRALRVSTLTALLAALACAPAGSARPPKVAPKAVTPAGTTSANTPPRPRAPAPPVPAQPPPGPLAEVEGDVPVTLEQVGQGGHFIAYCAARADTDGNGRLEVRVGVAGALSGDELRPELALGGRAAEWIDDLLGFAANGRYVVVRSTRIVSIIDVVTNQRTDLSALGFDDRDDTLPNRQHRALAFDARGETLAYLRKSGERAELVLRSLGTGEERVVADLPGEPWRFAWDASGEWLVVSSLIDDTNQNGRVDFPARLAKRARFTCDGPVSRFRVSPETGDRPSSVLVRRDGTGARVIADFVAPFGHDFLTRAKDGPLVLESAGKKRNLAPGECGARILHADPARGVVLIACSNGKTPQRAPVELVGAASRLELGVTVQPTSIDRWPGLSERLVPLYPGSEVMLFDLDRRKALPLRPGDRVVATSGTRALVRRGASLFAYDAEAATETVLISDTGRFADVLRDGSLAAVGSRIIDVNQGKVIGSVDGRPLALTPAGDVLVADGGAPSAERLARGPLRWRKPAAPID